MKFFYAARSDAKLRQVCRRLEAAYESTPFWIDWEKNWQYGKAMFGKSKQIAVTKAEDYRTVEKWRPGCPSGVNYQVVVTANSEPPDLLRRITEYLGVEVVKYLET